MTRISVSGINLNDFTARTQRALEATLGSPIKKDRITRQFLARQLHGGEASGQNEHNIAQFFVDQADSEQNTAQPHSCTMISVTKHGIDFGSDSLVIEEVTSHLCMTNDAVKRTLDELFRRHFPDHDGVSESLMDARLIEDYLEAHDDEDETLSEELSDMPSYEILDWLIETFPIETLVSDEGIRDILWMDHIDIAVTTEQFVY